ncbi:MAG: 4a-hydroxytetrahydrobiopterin dehydratase [Elusimicrobiota bacterium]|jgi:4a-hydroxytetrahydrobiopterin dehydratase
MKTPIVRAAAAGARCAPCREGGPSLSFERSCALLTKLDGWSLNEKGRLEKSWRFPDFRAALAFVVRVGALAEEEGHHPDVRLSWGKVALELWTHKAGGLTENDFLLASKVDRL